MMYGLWVDIVHWDSLEYAHAAQKAAMQSNICLSFFGMIDEATMQMHHFDIGVNGRLDMWEAGEIANRAKNVKQHHNTESHIGSLAPPETFAV